MSRVREPDIETEHQVKSTVIMHTQPHTQTIKAVQTCPAGSLGEKQGNVPRMQAAILKEPTHRTNKTALMHLHEL